jgi:glycosyltransferase involved in cell wall biosynthesis
MVFFLYLWFLPLLATPSFGTAHCMNTLTTIRLPSKMPCVTLVVNTFNAPDALEKVLAGVNRQSVGPMEVLIADDGSGPATGELLDDWKSRLNFPLTHVWQPHEGFRRTHVLNQAILQAKGDYLVFLDGDCVPHAEFVADHVALAEPGHWVQARRCFVKERYVAQFDLERISVAGWVLRRRIEQGLKAFRTPWQRMRLDKSLRGVIGCNLGIWREDVMAVNGYDESFTGWGREDSDLAARLFHLGRVRKFVRGRAVVFHLNHPVASRAQLESNQARLDETLATKRVRAVRGLQERTVDLGDERTDRGDGRCSG